MIVDSHCHLNYGSMMEDMDGVMARARKAGVETMLAINARLSEYDAVLAVAEKYDHVFATVGSHPHEAEKEPDVQATELIEKARHKKVVGIGESGLDFFYEYAPRDLQEANFRAHIAAARETGLPLIVHAREADDACIGILRDEMGKGAYPAVIHCFTASRAFAKASLELGFYISISGIVTFNSAKDLQQTAKIIPLDRLLIETDAPYLSPVPKRGKPNEPSYVKYTAAFLSELREIPYEVLAKATTDNFYKLFAKVKQPCQNP
ncbi:MAG: LuxR family transcriptional regulator [Alphaproteobacteria bacterium]|nr:MAG: LuxR family transcriptional regulator [Alphaproteobacteria bacterium]